METNNPLNELKDILENMKSVLTLTVESKMKSIEQFKDQFDSLVLTAEQMEMEKFLLNKIEEVKQTSKDINDTTVKINKEFQNITKAYL